MFIELDLNTLSTYFWQTIWSSYWNGKNTSLIPFPNKIWNVKSSTEIAIKTAIMVPIGLLGIFLNLIILVVLGKNRSLWSSSNFLIANLAFADLFTLVFCPWITLIKDFHQNFVMGILGCRLEGFIHATCILAGVGAVMLVSYDRLAIVALTAEARITRKSAPKLVALAWTIAILLSIPWIVFRKYLNIEWKDFLEILCIVNLETIGIYWHFIIILFVWIPLVLLVITYATILWSLNRSKKYFASRGGGKFLARARTRATRITACVLVAATVCRLPYTIVVLVRSQLHRIGDDKEIDSIDGIWFTVNTLMYLDCAINPLIYGFTNDRFKHAMDRTPVISWFRFGSWCCICTEHKFQDAQTTSNRVYVIEASPKKTRNFSKIVNSVLHKESFEINQTLPGCSRTEVNT